ncbi:MAG: carboxypeptidase-like regulatory domain-containing protein [Gemmatimonadota bacterium]
MTRLLLVLAMVTLPGMVHAQSGQAALNGWVAFQDIAYMDKQPTATVELRRVPPDTAVVYSMKTDEHGFYAFKRIGLGEFDLRITARGFKPYEALVYIPSDFVGNWATLLKKP